MKSRLLSILQYVIGWPLTVIAFIFIAKIIWEKFPQILPHIQQIQYGHLWTGIFFLITFYFLRSYVWYLILRHYKIKISYKETSYLWSLSELKRYIPGNVWSFIGRTHLFHQKNIEKKKILKGMLYEAELFVVGSAVIALLSLWLFFPDYPQIFYTGIFVVVGLFLVMYIFASQLKYKKKTFLASILPDFTSYESVIMVLVSCLALLFFGIGNYFIMTSVFITDPRLFWQFVGMFSTAFLAGYLAIISPAGFGVREGIVISILSRFTDLAFGAFIALYTRFALVISEVIFILLNALWRKSTWKWMKRVEALILRKPYETIVFVAASIYTFYFSRVTFLRYDNYFTGRFDLGNMVQTVWNTMHGKIFLLTNPDGVDQVSRLAFHADFILILLAPFYMMWTDPRTLLFIQTIILAGGAFFVYYIARYVLKNNPVALTFALVYLANPLVQRTNLYDFHAVTLATTFFLGTFYFYIKKNYVYFFIFAILAAICKEQLWLIIALFGIAIFFHHKKRVIGTVVVSFAIGMFYYLFWHAIPDARGGEHFAISYLSEFGDSPTQIIKSFMLEPHKIYTVINEEARITFLKQLLSPLGYLSLLFPFTLIFAGPDLMISLLSNNTQLHQIYYQYTATITPFLFVSAIYGVWVIRKFLPRIPTVLFIIYLLYQTLNAAASFGPLPGSKKPDIAMIIHPLPDKDFINNYVHTLPADVSVTATNNLGSHLSQRDEIFTVPLGVGKSDKVLVLLDPLGGEKPQKNEKEFVAKVKSNPEYILEVERGNFFVFSKRSIR